MCSIFKKNDPVLLTRTREDHEREQEDRDDHEAFGDMVVCAVTGKFARKEESQRRVDLARKNGVQGDLRRWWDSLEPSQQQQFLEVSS